MKPPRLRVTYLPGYLANAHHRGIVRYARKAGWVLDAGMAYNGMISERPCDGIIAFIGGRSDIAARIRAAGVPAVDLSHASIPPETPRVWHDNVAIGRMGGAHLIARGFAHIAFAGWFTHRNDLEREEGLKEAARKAGVAYHRIPVGELVEYAKKIPKPFAVMLQNDGRATEAVAELLDAGFDVPHEVAVLGADNDELYCDTGLVPLSSVDSAVEQCGYEAARMLDSLMAGGKPPAAPLLIAPTGVAERDSTRLIAIAHAPTSRALAYIRGRFAGPLDLDDIARSVGLGRRRLEDYFKEHVGLTMAGEMRRLRMEAAMKRVAETDDKLSEIATSCGFADGAHLAHAFRAAHGESPESFRTGSRRKKVSS